MPAPPPPTRASIKIVKTIPYRGGTKLWSNRYYLTGDTTLDTTQFNDLADAIEAAEKLTLSSWIGFVSATGYDAGSEVPVFSKTISGAGSMTHSGDALCPGDCAAMVRFGTDARSAKNHPIYLYKWFHGVYYQTSVGPDTVLPSQVTTLQAFADHCIAGFNDGSTTRPICGPYGAVAVSRVVSPVVRHRDFPS